ncbi:DUF3888 domain-containing protein [Sporosarcina sp. ACRSL]|uniref:DUF3888 domain-containing protein n=1 Tax=Sporosarcina sp. ACRSL TaxID=2918215 RepID=UPI001EF51913|nr:DUF3888 domain-containing protein [Sporosarcina sp. ACRSL]MCG7343220.1 DUF3888 domain-containing protein [Sporosarcina sp. ACRSL]
MKWLRLFFLFLMTSMLIHPMLPKAEERNIDQQSIKDALLTTLQPYISEGIIAYYGYDKSYGLHDAKIVTIQREDEGGFSFTVEVQVKTFETAENPPYGKETLQFGISAKGVKLLDFQHVGDDEEKKLQQFYKEALIDIKKSFHLNLLPYERYDYNQLRYKAEKQNDFNSLAHIAEEIVINILSTEIQPPYKNVISPVTFVKGDEAFILFKKADGTNFYYRVLKENGIWKVVEQESEKGKKMGYELLWYM